MSTPVHMLINTPARQQAVVLGEDSIVELADLFRIMGDGSRLRIMLSCLGEPVCVGDIAQQLGLANSLVSHHLRLLRAARVIRAQRRGKRVFYSVTDKRIRCVLFDMVDHVAEHPDDEGL